MGTGLGLSIVKRIVEAGGGKVSVKTQLGHGTTFVLRLPLADTQSLALERKAG
jgi:two-component system sensor histidine kinase SenX3